MHKIAKSCVAAIALAAIAAPTLAQVVGKTEDQIRWRQSAYQTMAWSMQRIKANVEGTFNKDQVAEAANLIQAVANSKMGALYQAGSDTGKGWRETNVKPEFFKPESREDLGKVAQGFGKEANEMAKIAAAGDAAAVKAQFGKLGEACKACHEKFRKEEKK